MFIIYINDLAVSSNDKFVFSYIHADDLGTFPNVKMLLKVIVYIVSICKSFVEDWSAANILPATNSLEPAVRTTN